MTAKGKSKTELQRQGNTNVNDSGGRYAASRTRCNGGNECGTRYFGCEPSTGLGCASAVTPLGRSENYRKYHTNIRAVLKRKNDGCRIPCAIV
jgi:hypothetical protein